MMKDWIGNRNSVYKTLGASNHTEKERQNEDYYATDPIAIDVLLNEGNIKFNKNIWEPAAGELHLSNRLKQFGYKVRSSDIIDRLHTGEIETLDFLGCNEKWSGDIITNPPYKYAIDFIKRSLELINDGNKVAMFLKLQFLEGKKRKELFAKTPPKFLLVSSSRILCAKNAEFEYMRRSGGSAVAYGWYIWEKGFKGVPQIKWIN